MTDEPESPPAQDGHQRQVARVARADSPEQLKAGRLLVIGGADARVLVCGVPLDDPDDTLADYERVFRALGAAEVHTTPFRDRNAGDDPALRDLLERASGVFFTGGDQLRATAQMAGTPFGERLYERLRADGRMIGGTSAGAAMMSSTMLIGGPNGGTVRRADIQLAPGLGLWRDAVVDTHFSQRGRITRLLTLLAGNPQLLAVGIDEDTAVEVEVGAAFRVIGRGAVLVCGGRVTYTNAAGVGDGAILALHGVRLHVLASGYGFDLTSRRPLPPPPA